MSIAEAAIRGAVVITRRSVNGAQVGNVRSCLRAVDPGPVEESDHTWKVIVEHLRAGE
jgi:hypothetical protein